MNTRLSALLLTVLQCVLWSAKSQNIAIYGERGGTVVLKPPASGVSGVSVFDRILWYQGINLAAEWQREENKTVQYPHFIGTSSVNILTGELTIWNLTEEQNGVYKVKINGKDLQDLGTSHLQVISAVPKPIITHSCNEEKTSCTLICEGNVTGMDPKPTYTWKLNTVNVTETPNNILIITRETNAVDFTCELKNPVSDASSERIYNPFIQDKTVNEDLPNDGPKVNTGIIVFASLLACVVGVALVHRVKSGMWFYQKDSMPWEADFWKKTETAASSEPQNANDDTERNVMMESNS